MQHTVLRSVHSCYLNAGKEVLGQEVFEVAEPSGFPADRGAQQELLRDAVFQHQ